MVDVPLAKMIRLIIVAAGIVHRCMKGFVKGFGSGPCSAAPSHTVYRLALTSVDFAFLDESFFRVRFDRLTPTEKRYLRAMSELGPGPHRSGELTDLLGKDVTSLTPTRAQLDSKGMIWSPSHGDTAFTVPLFDAFMRRIMPGEDWRA